MLMSVTLFEGVVLLIIAGISVVVWWGVKRLVKLNDDEVKRLENIDKSLAKICERLGKSDVWMELHSKQDDERHAEIKKIHSNLQSAIENLRIENLKRN